MPYSNSMTVGKYLVKRLEEAGLKHIFGVPGDYVLGFFDLLEASRMKVICTCNELNAGYAADAYARINGVGAVCVTYGVGGFSLFNAAVGAFAERVPLIVISGGPKLSERSHRHLLHHTIGDMNLQYNIYEKITVASTVLLSPEQAPREIDNTIAACLRYKRPVYIEVPVDIITKPCGEPGPFKPDTSIKSDKASLDEAVAETAAILSTAKNPAILAGVEVHRFNIRKELEELINHTGYPFASNLLGKAVLPEKHPQFTGVYNGAIGPESTRRVVEEADVLLSLGSLMTDVNLGIGTARLDISRMVVANSDNVRIKHHIYQHVGLKDFIAGLCSKLPAGKADLGKIDHPSKALKEDFTPVAGQKLTISRFYRRINHFIDKNHVILADAGDSLFCSAELFLPEGVEYIGQAFYLSIGYSLPATLGVELAAPDRRPVLFVGDGAFQMSAQELSTIIRNGLNPIIFLINNDGYTIERVINDGPYNDIKMWKYSMLPQVFGGGWGAEVKTEGELEDALKRAKDNPDSLAFIEVRLDKWDCSSILRNVGKLLGKQNVYR
ncbi:MAG: thiamine pyrophosphate-binding protein [Candidatus Omnitrophica bacterium]|nr:thiamine pyrophosphate-binding protein [Candidatus Omnitrophota bacterium]